MAWHSHESGSLRIASSSRVLGGTHWGQEEKSSSVVKFHGGASWLLINKYQINVKINLIFCEFHIQYSTHRVDLGSLDWLFVC